MVWFVDEYLDNALRKLDLCPSVDVSFSFAEAELSVAIFWHSPSANVGWYPICQVDVGGRTVFHADGAENEERWGELLEQAADALARALNGKETVNS